MSLVIEFLTGIRRFVTEQDGGKLREWLQVENEVPDHYFQLARELKTSFPDNGSDALERLVDRCLPIDDETVEGKGSPWPGFNSLMKTYLEYWRDVDFNNLVSLHSSLSDLLMYEGTLAHSSPNVYCTEMRQLLRQCARQSNIRCHVASDQLVVVRISIQPGHGIDTPT